MRSLHFLIKMVVTAALIASCVFVFMYPVSDLWTILTSNLPDNDLYRQILAVAAGVAIFLTFMPLWPKRKPKERTYTFAGKHGEVTVELEPVEATLERVLNKLPEVKWVTLRILPKEGDPPGIQVKVKGVFRREDASDVRLTSAWIQSFIATRTQKMLGVRDVDVSLHLKSQITNMRSVKPEPLMLEGPRDGGPETPSVADRERAYTDPAAAEQARERVPEAPKSDEEVVVGEPAQEKTEEPKSSAPDSRYSSPAFHAVSESSDAHENEDDSEADRAPVAGGEQRDGEEERRRPDTW